MPEKQRVLSFRDPDELTYRKYVTMQDEQETVVEGILDEFGKVNHDANLSPRWLRVLSTVFTPMRYPAHVLQIRCPHRASALSEGNLEGLTLTCATHLWEFNALTGRGINPESSELIRFPVHIENGMIYVEVPEAGAIPQHVDQGED